jgi:hypothetical protein
MNREFIPYEEALAMRKLGFDEPCFGYYNKDGVLRDRFKMDVEVWEDCQNSMLLSKYCSASLYQQTFRWFSDTYKLSSHVDLKSIDHTGRNYYYKIVNFADFIDNSTTSVVDGFPDYESAQIACLKQLIKYVS